MAQIGAIQGVAADRWGNLYIADTDHHRIRKISTAGIIATIAGTGEAGFSGDGGAASAARLNLPYGIAVDYAGYVYIADLGNNRVRRIAPDGTISTVAGRCGGIFGRWRHGRGGWPANSPECRRRWIPPATSTLRSSPATACAGWPPTAGSRPWWEPVSRASAAMAGRPPRPSSDTPPGWRWIATAHCTSPIPRTTVSAKSPRE